MKANSKCGEFKMNIIGIIGTAGRGPDGAKLNRAVYDKMYAIAEKFVLGIGQPSMVISGGAAWADHLAISLFLNGKTLKLRLYLPCEFDVQNNQFVDDGTVDWRTNPGGTSNYYHRLFSDKLERSTLEDISKAIDMGADIVAGGGMFDRNKKVAKEATHMISFTFGDKEVLKEGGTAFTMKAYLDQRFKFKQPDNSYHVDLNTMTLHKGAKVLT